MRVSPDGTLPYRRWVVTERGVALAFSECAGCHLRWIPGSASGVPYHGPYHGPSSDMPFPSLDFTLYEFGSSPYAPEGDSQATVWWRGHFVPWLANDEDTRIKKMTCL